MFTVVHCCFKPQLLWKLGRIMDSWALAIMNRTPLVLGMGLNCSENLTCITSSIRNIKTDFGKRFGIRPTQFALLMKGKTPKH